MAYKAGAVHLSILEDYICKLMDESLEKPRARRRVDVMCGELMDVLLLQEQLIPDFVVDGDSKTINIYGDSGTSQNLGHNWKERSVLMKKIAWLGATALVSGICFLIGFFVAP